MGVSETLRRSLIAGIVVIAPLVVTYVAFQFIFSGLRGFLNPIIENAGLIGLTGNVEIVAEILALLVLLAFVALLGYLAQRSVGAWVFGLIDRVIGLIPMVSVIYGSVRQVSDALLKQESRYESVVLVEHPRDGFYAIGFITSESPESVTSLLGEPAYNVYLPDSPNPTQGGLRFVPTDRVRELDMSVSRAIRLLVTTGLAEEEAELAEFTEEIDAQVADEEIDLAEPYR